MANGEMQGVVGIFASDERLKEAVLAIRGRRITVFDAFTPFPVHGLDEVMGLRRSFLPWVTFAGGLLGITVGLGFQIWTMAVDWPLNVGGKPLLSIPAFIPVAFETTILFAGLATAIGMFATLRLPNMKPVILDPSLTSDRFALYISSDDPQYDENGLKEVMKKAGADEVRVL